jgi:hypothetical protein
MSSRYSRRPSSCSVAPFGFICAIDSTSPCRECEKDMGMEEARATHLENEESFVIQIDTTSLEKRRDLGEAGRLAVDPVWREGQSKSRDGSE